MLYLGPRHFSPLSAFPAIAPKAPAKRARANIYNITQSLRHHHPSESASAAKATNNLAALPSYQFFPELSASFIDPEEAFQRGLFQRIQAKKIDLPPRRPPPDPVNARLWINRLPAEVRQMFEETAPKSFYQSTRTHVHCVRQKSPLPQPRVYDSKRDYVELLDKAEWAGMLHWSIVSDEDDIYSSLASDIEMTLFAVSKSPTRSRLISWPRVQKDAMSQPSYTSLPNPTMLDAVRIQGTNPGAFFLDIANMFHNITLRLWLARLLPMKPIPFSDFDNETQLRIAKRTSLPPVTANLLVRPCQATMPMGVKWAVFIAHTFVSSCFEQSFSLLSSAKLALPKMTLTKLQAEDAPFVVRDRSPLLLYIIDDAVVVTFDWPPELVRTWHRLTRRILSLNHLPIAEHNSSNPSLVVRDTVAFIGCLWNLTQGTVSPSPDKLVRILALSKCLLEARSATKKDWERVTGKLVWFAMLNRPLLSCTQAIFSGPTVPKSARPSIPSNKRELRTLAALLPLARVDMKLPLAHIIVAFDASTTAGAVTYAHVNATLAEKLWDDAQSARFSRQHDASEQLQAVADVVSLCQ